MTGAQLWFNSPVPVRDIDHVGRTINANNITRAAEVLLSWQERGPKWRVAVQACIDGETGKATAADVRRAFEAVAKEAGMSRGS